MKVDFREAVFKSSRTVFRLRDIAMLTGMRDADNLKSDFISLARMYAEIQLVK